MSGQKGRVSKGSDGTKIISTNNSFDVFGKIPGTPQYWKNYRNELFARMEQLGPFHFFFTLSAAEMKWPEVTTAILHYDNQIQKIVYEEGWEFDEEKIQIYFNGWERDKTQIKSLKKFKDDQRDKHKFFKEHFLLITRLFDNRVKAFISKILMANEFVEHYSYRIEFQVRGLPHLHGVFWLKEDKIADLKKDGEFLLEKLPALIEKFISCSTDTGDETLNQLVKEVNVHKHTKSCTKGNKECRFDFPKFPSEETIFAEPLLEENFPTKEEFEKKRNDAKDILKKVKAKLLTMSEADLEEKSLDSILEDEEVNVSKDAYHGALKISERGSLVILKRQPSEIWVNNYNPHILKAWQANMDIQFCLDNYAVITYITDYLTKGDAGLTRELKKALLETKHCNNFDQLNHLKMTYFKNKQVSVAEAAYRLIKGLDLKKSNIACTYLATGYPKNRASFFRPASIAEKIADSENVCEENQIVDEPIDTAPISIEGREGKFKEVETIHQKYSQRPKILEDVCLAQFASSYHSIPKSQIPKGTVWIDNASQLEGKNFLYFRNT